MTPLSPDRAETVALNALQWLVGHDELLPVFLGSTGASVADLKSGATDPAFLTSVLDFILLDDAWVTDCAGALNLPANLVMRARGGLAGGRDVHWT